MFVCEVRLKVASLPGHFACWRSSLTGRHDTGQLTPWLPLFFKLPLYLKILDIVHVPHSAELPTCTADWSTWQDFTAANNPLTFVHAQDNTLLLHQYSAELPTLLLEYSHIWLDPMVLHKASGQLTSDFCSGSRCLKILDIGPHFAWISAQLTRRNKQHGNAQHFWPTNPWLHTFVQAQVTLAWKSTLTGHCCSGHCTTASNFAKVLQQ